MQNSIAKANCFLKDLGITHDLKKCPTFTHQGVDFEYFQKLDGVGTLSFDGLSCFGDNPYTNAASFDGGAAVKVLTSYGNRSAKKHFAEDLKACISSKK